MNQSKKAVLIWRGNDNIVYAAAVWIEKRFGDGGWRYSDRRIVVRCYYTFELGETHSWTMKYAASDIGYDWLPFETIKTAVPHNIVYYANDPNVATVGLTETVRNSFLRYCQISKYGFTDGNDVIAYLGEYCRHPQIEMLTKLGFDYLVKSFIIDKWHGGGAFNWRAKTPAALFRLSPQDFRDFSKYNDEFGANQLLKLNGFRKIKKVYPKIDIKTTAEYCARYDNVFEDFTALIAKRKLSPVKVDNYITKQLFGSSYYNVLLRFRDYLDMAERLNYDMTQSIVTFPKDLGKAHEKAVELTATLKAELMKHPEKLFAKLYKKYFWENDEYIIRPPLDAQEIVAEGQMLQHCVGGYASRHMDGNVIILFIRRKDAVLTPYFTVEMELNAARMKQFYGFKDKRPDEDSLKQFAADYIEYLKKPKRESKKKSAESNQAAELMPVV